MIDINLIRENPELVKENIRKKFQDEKLPMVDEVREFDKENREVKQKGDQLRADRNKMSKTIGQLMREGKKDEANDVKAKVKSMGDELEGKGLCDNTGGDGEGVPPNALLPLRRPGRRDQRGGYKGDMCLWGCNRGGSR